MFLLDGIERRFIINPEPGGPLTKITGPLMEEDDGKEYIPQLTKKGECRDIGVLIEQDPVNSTKGKQRDVQGKP